MLTESSLHCRSGVANFVITNKLCLRTRHLTQVRHRACTSAVRCPSGLIRRRSPLQVSSSRRGSDWKSWKRKGRRWKDSRELRLEMRKQLFKPTAAVPVIAGLAVASMFGPLVLTIAASTLGLAFATVAGMTAVALFLPAAFFIGGTMAAFSILGSIVSLLGIIPLVAIGWTVYNRSGRAKVEAAKKEADIRRDEWQAKEYRRQQEELEMLRAEEQELEDFDRRLRSR